MTMTITAQQADTDPGDQGRTWWTRAACRGADVNLFFAPDKTESVSKAERQRRRAAAKALCHRCPVNRECLAEAIALRDRYAIRAAYTAEERKRLRLHEQRS
jgi:WhiB family redox-sensing transcriptional regulator